MERDPIKEIHELYQFYPQSDFIYLYLCLKTYLRTWDTTNVSKETCIHQKRLTKETNKRDLLKKRPTNSTNIKPESDFVYLYLRKYAHGKRPHYRDPRTLPILPTRAISHIYICVLIHICVLEVQLMCQKRPTYIKRDLQKRPTKETYWFRLSIFVFWYIFAYLRYDKCVKRDLHTSKETNKRDQQKRPTENQEVLAVPELIGTEVEALQLC